MLEDETDVALLGVELEHLADTTYELHHISALTMQMHLLLVNLTNVQDLVHQRQNSLGITFYRIDGSALFQLLQCRKDNGQRRADVVGSIDEELHLFLVQLLVGMTTIAPCQEAYQTYQSQKINDVSQRGAIPRRGYLDGDGLRLRIDACQQGPYLYDISAWLQMAQ